MVGRYVGRYACVVDHLTPVLVWTTAFEAQDEPACTFADSAPNRRAGAFSLSMPWRALHFLGRPIDALLHAAFNPVTVHDYWFAPCLEDGMLRDACKAFVRDHTSIAALGNCEKYIYI